MASSEGKASVASARHRGLVVDRYRGRWCRYVVAGTLTPANVHCGRRTAELLASLCRLRPARRLAMVDAAQSAQSVLSFHAMAMCRLSRDRLALFWL